MTISSHTRDRSCCSNRETTSPLIFNQETKKAGTLMVLLCCLQPQSFRLMVLVTRTGIIVSHQKQCQNEVIHTSCRSTVRLHVMRVILQKKEQYFRFSWTTYFSAVLYKYDRFVSPCSQFFWYEIDNNLTHSSRVIRRRASRTNCA